MKTIHIKQAAYYTLFLTGLIALLVSVGNADPDMPLGKEMAVRLTALAVAGSCAYGVVRILKSLKHDEK